MEDSRQREVELKYRLEDDTLLTSLRQDDRFLDHFSLGPRRRQQTVDIYWDTPDYALTRGGFGLRTRRQDGNWLVTLKELTVSPASALADRVEVETALDETTLLAFLGAPKLGGLVKVLAQSGWPPAGWNQVKLRRSNPMLRPLAVLAQTRDKRKLFPLEDAASDALGELSLDSVQIHPPPSATDLHTLTDLEGRAPAAIFREVEIEAAQSNQIEHFYTLAARLSDLPTFAPSQAGKAESALRWLAQIRPDGKPGIDPSLSMPEAGRQIWRAQLMEVLLNEVGVRSHQNEDAVHDMRVAIRRIRAAQRIFGPYFDQQTIKPYLRMLRETARILGVARDLDVALDLLDKYEISLAPLKKVWKKERREAYKNAQAWLSSKSYSHFLAEFDLFCRTPGMGVRTGSAVELAHQGQVRHVMPTEIYAHYTNMRAYETVMADAPLPVLHELRIEGKRLRYSLEFVAHLLDPEITPTLVKDLKTLQDRLGSINDAAVMGDRLRRFAEDHPHVAVDRALAHLDDVIENERASFAPLWTAFVGTETRKRIALAIAYL
jgi:CHAD domain-containing protein